MNKKTLGIDISKKKFDIALLRDGKLKHKSFSNDQAGFEALLTWLRENDALDVHACMEATGIYGEPAAEFLHDTGIHVSLVNPARIKGFAQSELVRTKTDKADAGLIARFCAAMAPEAWIPQPRHVRELRDLVRRLESLVDMRQQERNRLEAASEIIAGQLNEHIAYLERAVKETKRLINEHIDNHPDMRDNRRLLETIPGIGETTIHVILSEFADITRFKSAKALAAYLGVAPKVRESGSSLRGRGMMSKMGRRALRKSFFMPALVALRHNPLLVEMRQRLLANGKPKMAIVGAAMRKLVHIVYGVLKHREPFNAQLVTQNA